MLWEPSKEKQSQVRKESLFNILVNIRDSFKTIQNFKFSKRNIPFFVFTVWVFFSVAYFFLTLNQ